MTVMLQDKVSDIFKNMTFFLSIYMKMIKCFVTKIRALETKISIEKALNLMNMY